MKISAINSIPVQKLNCRKGSIGKVYQQPQTTQEETPQSAVSFKSWRGGLGGLLGLGAGIGLGALTGGVGVLLLGMMAGGLGGIAAGERINYNKTGKTADADYCHPDSFYSA